MLDKPGTTIRLRGTVRTYFPESEPNIDYADIDLKQGNTLVAVVVGFERRGEELKSVQDAALAVLLPPWVTPEEFSAWVEQCRLAYARAYAAGCAD